MSTAWTEKLQQYLPSPVEASKSSKLFQVTDFLQPGDSYMMKRIECSNEAEENKAMAEGQFAIDNPHPRICKCYDKKCEPKQGGGSYVYLLLEKMPLSFLDDINARAKTIVYYTESELWRILREAIEVYRFLQQQVSSTQHIAHRDVKPANILFDSERHLKVCDLGFMKTIDPKDPEIHTMLGTNPYYSPAQRKAWIRKQSKVQHDPFKSDVYSLGMAMLHAAQLELPLKLTVLSKLEQNLKEVISRMEYSQQWANILSRMLTVEEDDRPDFLALTEEIRRELKYSESEPVSNIGYTEIKTPLLMTTKCGLEYVRVGLKRFEEVPCMISLQAIDTSHKARSYALDLVCVIDESESMNTRKMKLVQNTLNKLLRMLRGTDRMCIIAFSNSAEIRCPLVPCDAPGRKKLSVIIQQLVGRDMTNITAGLMLAAEVMEQRLCPNTGAAILLFSDGQHNRGDPPLPTITQVTQSPAFQAANVRISTFGYGSRSDSELLTAIAKEGKGVFRPLSSPEEVQPAFALAFAELTTTVAKDVEVTLQPLPGPVNFSIETVYSKDGRPSFQIPNIIANQSKDLVFFIKAPYVNLEEETPRFPAVHVTVAFTNSENQKQVIEGDVMVMCRPWTGEKPGQSTSVFVNWCRVKGARALSGALKTASQSPREAIQQLLNAEDDIASSGFDFHPVIKAVLGDLRKVMSGLETTHQLDKNQIAQMKMISYSHISQVGTGPQSFYRSPQQSEAVQEMTSMSTIGEDEVEDVQSQS